MRLGKNLRCKLRQQLGIILSRSKGTKGEDKTRTVSYMGIQERGQFRINYLDLPCS